MSCMFTDEPNPRYQEILKLDRMLTEASIPHTLDRRFDGWQICYPTSLNSSSCIMDAVEHFLSYRNGSDLLEIMGLLTPEEEECDSVLGGLAAEEVFERILTHYNGEWDSYNERLSEHQNEDKITPEAAALEMQRVHDEFYDDKERVHEEMDTFMCRLLKQLGYDEAVKIFVNTDKWYS